MKGRSFTIVALLAISAAAACGSAKPKPVKPIGEPAPSATTSAEPLWLRNDK